MRRFITTAGCLFALVMAVTIQSAQAQSGPPTTSGNQKSITSSACFTRLGYLVVPYHSSARIATNGQLVSGGTAKASNNMTVTFDVGCDITKHIVVSTTLGIPPKPHITGEGAVANLDVLGKVRYGPAFFTGYYRLPTIGRFRPYVGGGAAYAIIFKEFDGSVKHLQVHNNWGSVLQGGAEYQVNSKYTVFVDFKEVWLAVNAHGVLSDGTAVKARVKLNPSLVTVGIKFHLPFGRSH